jgi:uncharacterized membrane protein YeaQ/YmgE (transglycosylase-associated protein family)
MTTAGNQPETRCGCRKHAVTGLRCNRCDTPICPDCSKPGAVGFVCRACAAGRKNPMVDISAGRLAICGVVGLVSGLVAGWLVRGLPFGFLLSLVATYFAGSVSGEVVLRTAGRKRGFQLELITGISVGAGFLLAAFIRNALMDEVGIALVQILTGTELVAAAIAGYGAYSRIRFL